MKITPEQKLLQSLIASAVFNVSKCSKRGTINRDYTVDKKFLMNLDDGVLITAGFQKPVILMHAIKSLVGGGIIRVKQFERSFYGENKRI